MRRRALALLALSACGEASTPPPPSSPPVQGSLRFSWSFADGAGAPKSCEEAGVTTLEIRVGGEPHTEDCALGGFAVHHLLPDRYPIDARALGGFGGVIANAITNGVVVAGSTTAVPLAFVVDEGAGARGDLAIRWRIDGQEPARACAQVGAELARVVGGAGSLERFELTEPCTVGTTTVRDLRAGVYAPEVRLERSDGSLVAVGVGSIARVMADQLTEAQLVEISTMTGPPTRLVAYWTVNSSAAATACEQVRGRDVTFRTSPRPPFVSSSTTVPCARGSAELNRGS